MRPNSAATTAGGGVLATAAAAIGGKVGVTAKAQKDLGIDVPDGVIEAYEAVADQVDLDSIAARERATRHDVNGALAQCIEQWLERGHEFGDLRLNRGGGHAGRIGLDRAREAGRIAVRRQLRNNNGGERRDVRNATGGARRGAVETFVVAAGFDDQRCHGGSGQGATEGAGGIRRGAANRGAGLVGHGHGGAGKGRAGGGDPV